jgi:hypothetical protein
MEENPCSVCGVIGPPPHAIIPRPSPDGYVVRAILRVNPVNRPIQRSTRWHSRRMAARFEGNLSMSDDDRDFIERADSVATNLHGQSMTTEEIANNFALLGLQKRTEALDKFDTELRGDIDSNPHSLRRHVQLMALRKKMASVHEALRKARR